MNPQLPNLIVIGAMKCGTTSLHAYLDQHADIFMSEEKELDYFVESGNLSKGIDWYKDQFITDKKYRGESSQNYTKCHVAPYSGIAERISTTLSDLKLIYVVRDPIRRLESHYAESVTGEHYKSDIKQWLGFPNNIGRQGFVGTGDYYLQLSEYLRYFDQSQIHVVAFEHLTANTLECMNQIFDFLGVVTIDDAEVFQFAENISNNKQRRSSLGELVSDSRLSKMIRKSPIANLARTVVKSGIIKPLTHTNFDKERMPQEVIEELKPLLSPNLQRFRALTEMEFKEWSI